MNEYGSKAACFCIQHLPCSVTFRSVLGGSAKVEQWSILDWFSEGHPQFGMQRGCSKWVWPLNEPKEIALHSLSNSTSSEHASPQVERNYCMQDNRWESLGTNSRVTMSYLIELSPSPLYINGVNICSPRM
jgi:hypothetical protein